eukprot:11689849-Alexandrium_andersonii.AAC.1
MPNVSQTRSPEVSRSPFTFVIAESASGAETERFPRFRERLHTVNKCSRLKPFEQFEQFERLEQFEQ